MLCLISGPFQISLVICWSGHIAAEHIGIALLLHTQQRDHQLSIWMLMWATSCFITHLHAMSGTVLLTCCGELLCARHEFVNEQMSA